MNEKKCSGERCPMQYPYNADTCMSADDCMYYSPKKDLVEVVRCRDCVAAEPPDNRDMIGRIVLCKLYSSKPIMRCDEFCSYGERRNDG